MAGLGDNIPGRYAKNSLSDLTPELIVGLRMISGRVYFVNSAAASGGNGLSWDGAFQTIAAALLVAQADSLVLVAPGHTESVTAAAGIATAAAGVSVIGQGQGSRRPTITMNAAAATVALNHASCRIENLLFQVGADFDVTLVVDINAAGCIVKDCEIRSRIAATAREFVAAIDINGGAANACDRTKIIGCKIYSPTAGASHGIELGEVADEVEIVGCTILGDYADACIHNPTGKVLTRLLVSDCLLENTQTGDHAIELVSACTGMLVRNMYKSDMTQATASDPGSCFSYECYHDDAIDTSAIISPAVT